MKDEKFSLWTVIFGFTFSCLLLGGGWFYLSKGIYSNVIALLSGYTLVEINVYALWMPVGFIGILIWIFCGFITALIYGKKVNTVWSDKTERLLHRLIGLFGILGLVFAIAMYQWLGSELKARGYIYCEGESSLSAMGKHEVYMKPVCDNAYYEANR
ncbi:hypothetical protein [Moritella viscosa]|uniref:hypothetical protein n=1 Tax=Moritella viscosa TaxID=80854 RepID=UPI00094C5F1A|nr:hypothetical protein [Moritella viscosa]